MIVPKTLYHFTSSFGLFEIIRSGFISLTENNFGINEKKSGVVWLASSPDSAIHGLKFNNTKIKISLPFKPLYKKSFISSASAENTSITWYISESAIPINEIIFIENLTTGKSYTADEFPVKFSNEIDEYISQQPVTLQYLLFDVRLAIREALPDATEKMSWQMPTFWNGRNLIHFAAQKNHLGIYPGAEAMQYFAPRLNDYKTS